MAAQSPIELADHGLRNPTAEMVRRRIHERGEAAALEARRMTALLQALDDHDVLVHNLAPALERVLARRGQGLVVGAVADVVDF